MKYSLVEEIRQEVQVIKRRLEERPESFSEYGKAYWDGNVAALEWALKKIHLSAPSANKEME